ncbi:MAG: PH domain-containing protein [Micromonosporaceae bacterium]
MTAPHAERGTWRRLHPLSPLVSSGRLVVGLLAVIAVTRAVRSGGGDGVGVYDLVIVAVVAVAGLVKWLVTRWTLDGATLRIETGLLRRDSRQLPVARIQAVDLVRPFLARLLGVAELRIRLAGSSSTDGRLGYLSEQIAVDLRARLLAAHHGLDPATPEPSERLVATVPVGRLAGSVILSGAALSLGAGIATLIVVANVPAAAAALGGTIAGYLILLVSVAWRRFASQYGFTVAESGDGIRIRRGLLSTVAETIPIRRVQAVRMIEPLLWRPLGWCEVEVDVAGRAGRDEGERQDRVRKALLPVGSHEAARHLIHRVIGDAAPRLSRPPARARMKAPLSYHFLGAGYDGSVAMTVTGRVRKVTVWLPLEKAQSVRFVQGPVQRRLGIATVHVDAAGRRVRAEFRDRDCGEARELVDVLASLSRSARARGAGDPPGAAAAPGVPAAGWFPDPAGRHEARYWDGAIWTGHVSDGGVHGIDPP